MRSGSGAWRAKHSALDGDGEDAETVDLRPPWRRCWWRKRKAEGREVLGGGWSASRPKWGWVRGLAPGGVRGLLGADASVTHHVPKAEPSPQPPSCSQGPCGSFPGRVGDVAGAPPQAREPRPVPTSAQGCPVSSPNSTQPTGSQPGLTLRSPWVRCLCFF